jgi:cell filamentation protein
MSRYEADDIYCIPGTAVLKNKAGITDQYLLDEYEGDFTAIRLLELAHNPIAGAFDLAHPARLARPCHSQRCVGVSARSCGRCV